MGQDPQPSAGTVDPPRTDPRRLGLLPGPPLGVTGLDMHKIGQNPHGGVGAKGSMPWLMAVEADVGVKSIQLCSSYVLAGGCL